MSLNELIDPFPWYRYSKKLRLKILNPRNFGFFTEEDAKNRSLRRVLGEAGSIDEGNYILFYWLLDRDDGTIVDARYQLFGQTALIGALEGAIELMVGKNYDQASRITSDLIDKQLRDKPKEAAFPNETWPHLNLVLEAIDSAKEKCLDLPLPTNYSAPPISLGGTGEKSEVPNWKELTNEQKIAIIEKILDEDIRPYIALDAGGVKVVKVLEGGEIVIRYEGACTSCYSSIGTTLSFIQQTLRYKVHPNIELIPDVDFTNPYPA